MRTAQRASTIDLTAIPRAVLSLAAEMVHTMERAVIGDGRIRTARGNAWEAICADRARAHHRDEVRKLVAALATQGTPVPAVTAVTAGTVVPNVTRRAGQVRVGSSPRSSASHT